MKTNKELKKEYKQKKPRSGVFQVENKVTGKVLIEGSIDMPARWNRHRMELRFGSHRNKQLQADWKQGGEENFIFSILSELEVEESENLDLKKEVKILEEMVLEEMGIEEDKKY